MASHLFLHSVIADITTLGTNSVIPIPTNDILRNPAVDIIQSSTYTSTATSISLDTMTTRTSAQFQPRRRFMQTWKPISFLSYHLVSALWINGTVTTSPSSNCSSIYQCNGDFGASIHWSGHSSEQDPEFEHGYSTNKKRLFGSRSPKARHLSAPAAVTSSSDNFPLSSFIVPFAMCYLLENENRRSAFTDLCATARFNLE